MKLYLLSGLGADQWIFKNLLPPEELEVVFIPWHEPKQGDILKSYTKRMSEVIDTSEPFLLGGVSFGGVCAQEMCRWVRPEKLVLISTISKPNEKPIFMRLGSIFGFSQLLPASFFKWMAIRSGRILGIRNSVDIANFKKMAKQYSPLYYKWSVGAIVNWKGFETDILKIRLHGDRDKVFPSRYIQGATIIAKGEHIMIMDQADQISEEIKSGIYK